MGVTGRGAAGVATGSGRGRRRLLDSHDRSSEVLFGPIMALAVTGCAFGRIAGWGPWVTGVSMVLLGSARVNLTTALGG